jgi:phage baseplate assembly protein W
MNKSYYKVPFNFESFFEQKDLKKISLKESISQYISIIITTAFKEYKHDHSFGSEIWETDFDLLTNVNRLKERIKTSLSTKVKTLEKRLSNINVNIILGESVVSHTTKTRLKKQLKIEITGVIKKTNEPYYFTGMYYIAPLSYGNG